jgi:hypothetical protein
VSGIVKNDHGIPIPHAWVTINSMLSETYTSDAGDFWRILVPGRYQVTVSAKGYLSLTKVALCHTLLS